MSADETGHLEVGHAQIDVSKAELYITPGAREATHRLRLALAWSLVVLFAFTIAIGAANLLFTNSQVHKVRAADARIQQNSMGLIRAEAALQQQIRAGCGFYADLAGLPVTNGLNGRPSEVLTKIISDSRVAWHQKGCTGSLVPPSPAFIQAAKLYHLPVS